MNPTRVVNKYHEPYDISIMRSGSKWGNPYTTRDLSRTNALYQCESLAECLRSYAKYLFSRPDLLRALHELKGKRLGCCCRPKEGFQGRVLCHGQILAALVEGCKPGDIP